MYFVEFKMFLRCDWTSPYEHLCDTGISLIPYGEQMKYMYVLLEKNLFYTDPLNLRHLCFLHIYLTFMW